MYIAIEGLVGTNKLVTAQELARILGYKLVAEPITSFKYLTNTSFHLLNEIGYIYSRVAGQTSQEFQYKDIITSRCVMSSMVYSEYNMEDILEVYRLLKIRFPDIIFYIESPLEKIQNTMQGRNLKVPSTEDLNRYVDRYKKAISILKQRISIIKIDSDNLVYSILEHKGVAF